MGKIILFLATFAVSASASAEKVLFYQGNVRLMDLNSSKVAIQPLILKKVVDKKLNQIVETVCFIQESKKPRSSSIYMKIDGENVSVSDNEGQPRFISGEGKVSGDNWSYLKLQINAGAVFIEDSNFITGNMLVARKQIFLKATGAPLQLWEADLKQISKENYDSSYKKMGCSSNSH